MFGSIKNLLSLLSLSVELLKWLHSAVDEIVDFIIKKKREKQIEKAVEKAKTTKDTSDLEKLTRNK